MGVQVELEIKLCAAADALTEVGVDIGAVKGVGDFPGKGGVVLYTLLA